MKWKGVLLAVSYWNDAHDDPRCDDCSRGFTCDAGFACRQAKITTETGVSHGFRDPPVITADLL